MLSFCHERYESMSLSQRIMVVACGRAEGTVGQHHLEGPEEREESDKGGGFPCNLSATPHRQLYKSQTGDLPRWMFNAPWVLNES